MMDTIRERIIQGFVTTAGEIRTANGYATDLGLPGTVPAVYRAQAMVFIPPAEPQRFVGIWPDTEEQGADYSGGEFAWSITVQGVMEHGEENPSVVAERMLGDFIEAFTATVWTVPFASGSVEISVGDTVTGATSGLSGYVAGVNLAAGSWAGGDAAGTLTVRRLAEPFFPSEVLRLSGAPAAAVTAAGPTGQTADERVCDSLADGITYTSGGPTSYPDAGETLTSVAAVFTVIYRTARGNPFNNE